MREAILALVLCLVAGCSNSTGASPEATETAASTKASQPVPVPTETPMTADRCLEDNKAQPKTAFSEKTKTCLTDACDEGDESSCDLLENPDGNKPDEEQADEEDSADESTAK